MDSGGRINEQALALQRMLMERDEVLSDVRQLILQQPWETSWQRDAFGRVQAKLERSVLTQHSSVQLHAQKPSTKYLSCHII